MRSGIATIEREIEDAVVVDDGNDNNGKPDARPPRADFGYLDGMSDEMKVIELEHEVEGWRDKYERAMARLGENPYAQLAPHTAVPPNMGNDDGMYGGGGGARTGGRQRLAG